MFYLYLILFTYIFLSWKYRKFNNPYKLYMVFGKKGSGKSSYLAKSALKYKKKGYTIYTNMEDLNIPNVRFFNPSDLGKFVPEPRSCILLDEVGMLYDNRDYKNFKPETRDFFKLQRHYSCVVYLASQTFDIDKKLRDLTDRMFLVTAPFPWLSLVRPISKRIALVEASSQGESRIAENLKFCFFTSYRFTFLPKYIKYFDSFKAPEKPHLEYKLSTVNESSARAKGSLFARARSRLIRREAAKKF